MSYRVSQNINLPFKITPVIQEYPDDGRIEFSVKVRSIFEATNYANNVVIKIPVPSNTASVKVFSAGNGKGKYEPDKSSIFWRIKKFQGYNEQIMTAVATLTTTKESKQW